MAYHKKVIAPHARARKGKGTYSEGGEALQVGFAARGGKADWKKSFRDVFPGACEKANFAVDPRWLPPSLVRLEIALLVRMSTICAPLPPDGYFRISRVGLTFCAV